MNKILIIGVAGFLGRAQARYFHQKGWKVYGLDCVAPENAPLADLVEYASLQLPDDSFGFLLKGWQPNALIHCAGRASVPQSMLDPASDYRDGPALTFFLLETLRKNLPDCTFIFLSSAAIYGNPPRLPVSEDLRPNPISVYGYHKWQSEILCAEFAQVFGLQTASARIFSAYGPGLRRQVMWDLIYKALTQPEVRLQGTGEESRDFIHMQDIARGLEVILTRAPARGEAYNLASGIETRIADLAGLILSELDQPIPVTFLGEMPPGTPGNWRSDITALSRLGFHPEVELASGVIAYTVWAAHEIRSLSR